MLYDDIPEEDAMEEEELSDEDTGLRKGRS